MRNDEEQTAERVSERVRAYREAERARGGDYNGINQRSLAAQPEGSKVKPFAAYGYEMRMKEEGQVKEEEQVKQEQGWPKALGGEWVQWRWRGGLEFRHWNSQHDMWSAWVLLPHRPPWDTPEPKRLGAREVHARLRQLAAMKRGARPPDWMPDNDWAENLSALCDEAADLIGEYVADVEVAESGHV